MMNKFPAQRMDGITSFFVMELLNKTKQLEQKGIDVIHMEIGEPDFSTPKQIVDAGIDFLRKGNVKYTSAQGLPQLRECISQYYRDIYGVSISANRIFVTPGASGAFLLAFGISLESGKSILMPDPCYPCNANFIRLYGGTPKTVDVSADTNFQLTPGLIQRNWTDECAGVLIASPSNPTGTVISTENLKNIITLVDQKEGNFYSDEIYHGLMYQQKATSALQFDDMVFVINSFSKYFGMTGWRIGWLVVPESFVEPAIRLCQNIFISTSAHSQHGALAAFEPETILELEQRRREFENRKNFLCSQLREIGFSIPCEPQGAFYVYVACDMFTDDSFKFSLDLLEKAGVAVTPGIDFGLNQSKHFIRLAYTTSIEKMQEGVSRIRQFIKQEL